MKRYVLASSSKSHASMLKKYKRWVGTYLGQEGVRNVEDFIPGG